MTQYLDTTEKLKCISVFKESIIILRIQEFGKLLALQIYSLVEQVPKLELACSMDIIYTN